MISDYVMTEHNCRGSGDRAAIRSAWAPTPWTRTIRSAMSKDGHASNEGDVQVRRLPAVSDRLSLDRAQGERVRNLLVPVCLSASHIAYGSIRMEPVFMVLGQSAATAACQAIDGNSSVQGIDMAKLQARLTVDKQVLQWTGPKGKVR